MIFCLCVVIFRHALHWYFADCSSRDCVGNLAISGSIMTFSPLGDFDEEHFKEFKKTIL